MLFRTRSREGLGLEIFSYPLTMAQFTSEYLSVWELIAYIRSMGVKEGVVSILSSPY